METKLTVAEKKEIEEKLQKATLGILAPILEPAKLQLKKVDLKITYALSAASSAVCFSIFLNAQSLSSFYGAAPLKWAIGFQIVSLSFGVWAASVTHVKIWLEESLVNDTIDTKRIAKQFIELMDFADKSIAVKEYTKNSPGINPLIKLLFRIITSPFGHTLQVLFFLCSLAVLALQIFKMN